MVDLTPEEIEVLQKEVTSAQSKSQVDRLLPCPFCGLDGVSFKGPFYLGHSQWQAGCENCGIWTGKYGSKKAATTVWNGRARYRSGSLTRKRDNMAGNIPRSGEDYKTTQTRTEESSALACYTVRWYCPTCGLDALEFCREDMTIGKIVDEMIESHGELEPSCSGVPRFGKKIV